MTHWKKTDFFRWVENGCNKEEGDKVVELDLHTAPKDRDKDENLLKECPKEVGKLVNLTHFYITGNPINELPKEICDLENLIDFSVCACSLKKLPKEIGKLKKLKSFHLCDNLLEEFPNEIGDLESLEKLYFTFNFIKEFPISFGKLKKLKFIQFSYNKIYSFSNLAGCRSLTRIIFDNNPVDIYTLPVNIHRRLNGQPENIYGDGQNVHDSGIQESVKKSLEKLLRIQVKEPQEILMLEFMSIAKDQEINQFLFDQFRSNDIHSELKVTYIEIFCAVYNIIRSHVHKDEMVKVLVQQMKQSSLLCFTGRISNLISALDGFTGIVRIEIPLVEQLSFIFIKFNNKKDLIIEELKKRNISLEEKIVQEWLNYL